jgi:hypothetical protein
MSTARQPAISSCDGYANDGYAVNIASRAANAIPSPPVSTNVRAFLKQSVKKVIRDFLDFTAAH